VLEYKGGVNYIVLLTFIMQLFHHYHRTRTHHIMHTEFALYELSVWLHVFSRSLISVFIPILLLQTGYSIESIVMYYFFYHFFDVPLNFVADWLIRIIGARWVVIIGSLSSITFFVGLYNLRQDNWPLLVCIALFAAIYDAFYWVAHLYIFMKCSTHKQNAVKDTSALYIVQQLGSMLAPAFGALILIFFNQQVLIFISVIILLFSIWPLFYIKNIQDTSLEKRKSLLTYLRSSRNVRKFFPRGLYAVHVIAEDIIWPMFVFVIFGTIESVAYIPVIISFTTMVFIYASGKIQKRRVFTLILGSIFMGIVWIFRLLFEYTSLYYISVFFMGLLSVFVAIPIESIIFETGKKSDTLLTSTVLNSTSMFFKLLMCTILLIMIHVFHVSFVIAALSMFALAICSRFFSEYSTQRAS